MGTHLCTCSGCFWLVTLCVSGSLFVGGPVFVSCWPCPSCKGPAIPGPCPVHHHQLVPPLDYWCSAVGQLQVHPRDWGHWGQAFGSMLSTTRAWYYCKYEYCIKCQSCICMWDLQYFPSFATYPRIPDWVRLKWTPSNYYGAAGLTFQ